MMDLMKSTLFFSTDFQSRVHEASGEPQVPLHHFPISLMLKHYHVQMISSPFSKVRMFLCQHPPGENASGSEKMKERFR